MKRLELFRSRLYQKAKEDRERVYLSGKYNTSVLPEVKHTG